MYQERGRNRHFGLLTFENENFSTVNPTRNVNSVVSVQGSVTAWHSSVAEGVFADSALLVTSRGRPNVHAGDPMRHSP